MKTKSLAAVRSLSVAGSAALLAALAGCGSAPTSEDVASGHQAYTYDDSLSYGASQVNALINTFLEPQGSTLSVTNNVLTFTPSPAMQSAGVTVQVVPIPELNVSAGSCGTASISISSMTLASPLAITLGATGVALDATVNFSGVANTSTWYCPNPDITLTNAPVHASLDTANGNLVVNAASISLAGYSSTTCGLFDWCGSFAESFVNNGESTLNATLSAKVQSAATAAQAGLYAKIVSAEAQLANLPAGTSLVPGSMSIGNSQLSDTVAYQAVPPTLTCAAAETCGGTNEGEWVVTCNPIAYVGGFNIALEEQVNGAWQTLQSQTLETPGNGASFNVTFPLSSTPSSPTFQVCSSDATGTACGPAFVGSGYLTSCGPVLVNPTPPTCPSNEVWNANEGKCVWSCSTPACKCVAQGGVWDGKGCE